VLNSVGIDNPIICTSVNKIGFRMSGGREVYEEVLKTKRVRAIAMMVLAGGAIPANEAMEYVCNLPNIESILFGASSKENIRETASLIHKYDHQQQEVMSL
jgi:predicted aldo/keto reductase-like oxidoreductase